MQAPYKVIAARKMSIKVEKLAKWNQAMNKEELNLVKL
jgi:hypothetical protein